MLPGKNGVASPQRLMTLLALSKVGGAAPALTGLCAKFCTINDLGAGDYEIVVNTQRPFAQKVHAVATPHTPGFVHVDIANTDKLKVTVKALDVDGVTPAELDFELIVVGSYASDLIG